MAIAVEVANEQNLLPVEEARLADAAESVFSGEGIASGSVSIAVVDDAAIHLLNRKYLAHDYPTDVLSFALEQAGAYLEGEVVVSAQTALTSAGRLGWRPADELLLYVVHGCLHLCGYDDQTPEEQSQMRVREQAYLSPYGLAPRYDE